MSVENLYSGNLTEMQIIPDTYELAVVTGYNFYFTTNNIIPMDGQISIYFPEDNYANLSSQAVDGFLDCLC